MDRQIKICKKRTLSQERKIEREQNAKAKTEKAKNENEYFERIGNLVNVSLNSHPLFGSFPRFLPKETSDNAVQ